MTFAFIAQKISWGNSWPRNRLKKTHAFCACSPLISTLLLVLQIRVSQTLSSCFTNPCFKNPFCISQIHLLQLQSRRCSTNYTVLQTIMSSPTRRLLGGLWLTFAFDWLKFELPSPMKGMSLCPFVALAGPTNPPTNQCLVYLGKFPLFFVPYFLERRAISMRMSSSKREPEKRQRSLLKCKSNSMLQDFR